MRFLGELFVIGFPVSFEKVYDSLKEIVIIKKINKIKMFKIKKKKIKKR
jgi:hypothetical protein